MSLDQFQLLPPLAQLFYALRHGALVASRQESNTSFSLYVLPGLEYPFYVEVESLLEAGRRRSTVCGSFRQAAPEFLEKWR